VEISTYIALMEIIFSTEAIKISDRGESSGRKAMFPVDDFVGKIVAKQV